LLCTAGRNISDQCGNSGRRMGREKLCTAGRNISDHYVVIVEGEWEENCCVPPVE
jgi:hypothetical protein